MRELQDAIINQKDDLVKNLLESQIDIDAQDPINGCTFVMYAVMYAGPPILKLLCDKKPNLEIKDFSGNTVFDHYKHLAKRDPTKKANFDYLLGKKPKNPEEESQLLYNSLAQAEQTISDLKKQQLLEPKRESKYEEKKDDINLFMQLSRAQREFAIQFTTEFNSAHQKFVMISQGVLQPLEDGKDKMAKMVKTAAKAAPNLSIPIPIPGVSIALPTSQVIEAGVDIALYVRTIWRKSEADKMYDLFRHYNLGEYAVVVENAAIFIAKKYHSQLEHLESGEKGISLFAKCAANRVIDYIISNEKHQIESEASKIDKFSYYMTTLFTGKNIPAQLQKKKTIINIFLDGMLRVTQYSGDRLLLQTINGAFNDEQWTSKGLIENSGIITHDKIRYAHLNCQIDNYGYVYGTEEEAKTRGLDTINSHTKEQWGPGRQWNLSSHHRVSVQSLVEAHSSGLTLLNGSRDQLKNNLQQPLLNPKPKDEESCCRCIIL